MGTFRVAAGPAARAAHPEPPLARRPSDASSGPPSKPAKLFVVHNTGLAAPRANCFAQHWTPCGQSAGGGRGISGGSRAGLMGQLRTASSPAARGGWRMPLCQKQNKNCPPPFLRRKDSPASETPKRKPLPRMDNGFSYFQMYGKKISLALVIVSIMEHPAVTVHII